MQSKSSKAGNVKANITASSAAHSEAVGDRVAQSDLASRSSKTFEEAISQAASLDSQAECEPSSRPGCGLPFLVSKIREHFSDNQKKYKNIPTRLIGQQAITLARLSYHLVDALSFEGESDAEKIKRFALGKACLYLRDAGTLFSKVATNNAEVVQLQKVCSMYFNILALFFPEVVNVTVWSVGYAIPYHAALLFEKYKVGYGIISLQAKESKHSGVKQDMIHTNRSRSTGSQSKWWHLMRANYVRAFYLPENQPVPSVYTSHYQSHLPPHTKDTEEFCQCGRQLNDDFVFAFCQECEDVLVSVMNMKLSDALIKVLKPISCTLCKERFSDREALMTHSESVHSATRTSQAGAENKLHLQSMKVSELKKELKARGKSVFGDKQVLIRRLESLL